MSVAITLTEMQYWHLTLCDYKATTLNCWVGLTVTLSQGQTHPSHDITVGRVSAAAEMPIVLTVVTVNKLSSSAPPFF